MEANKIIFFESESSTLKYDEGNEIRIKTLHSF